MAKKVLIIGGAGFIGSHTADELFKRAYQIRILDNLSPKTHFGSWPSYLNPEFEKVKGDVRSREDLLKSLEGIDYVIHLAAQMDLMPEFSVFFDTNVTSTALLYELIVENKLPIQKVIVASSQFVYGEGHWYCSQDGGVYPQRTTGQLLKGRWDPLCPKCGGIIEPRDNLENHQDPPNQYAISKYTQELIALKIGRLYGVPSVAMRYSIVHGPRQSLKNAYSGALRIFALKLLNNLEPTIYEDGLSRRDYVSVYDVARANALVLEKNEANFENFNVGGGKAYTVLEIASLISKLLGKQINLRSQGSFRVGDIRHAVSDISKLKRLGWEPKISEEEIVRDYLDWIKLQKLDRDYLAEAEEQLRQAQVVRKVYVSNELTPVVV